MATADAADAPEARAPSPTSRQDDDEPPCAFRFKHNARVLATLFLPLVLLLDFSGGFLRGAAAIGTMVAYILHALAPSEACFVALWVSIFVQAIGQAISAFLVFGFGARALGLGVLVAAQVVLVGVWLSLQFDWLLEQSPDLALLGERLLFNVLPLTSAAITAWGAGALYSAECTPAVLLASLAAGHLLLAPAAPASFAPRGAVAAAAAHAAAVAAHEADPISHDHPPPPEALADYAYASDASASSLQAACVALLPPLYYAVLHKPVLKSDVYAHLGEVRTLVALGLLLLSSIDVRHARRWAPPKLLKARSTVQLLSLVGLAAAAHESLSARSYRGALFVIEPPLGPALLAVALGSPLLLLLLRTRGMAPPPVVAGLGFVCLASTVGVLGLPRLYQLAALVGALSGAHGVLKANVWSCVTCGLSLTAVCYGCLQRGTGFLKHTFVHAAVSLVTVNRALIAMAVLCAIAIGCSVVRVAPTLRASCLLVHCVMLAAIEVTLIVEGTPGVYPAPVLAASVAGGLFLCERLQAAAPASSRPTDRKPSPWDSHGRSPVLGAAASAADMRTPSVLWWALLSAHAGRAALLFSPSLWSYLDGVIISAALTQRLQMALGARESRPGGGGASPEPMGASGMLCRLTLVAVAAQRSHASLLPALIGIAIDRPPPAMLLGAALVVYAAGGHMLAFTLKPVPRALTTRLCVWLVAAGVLLAALQPVLEPLILIESLLWTLFHPTASLTFGGTPRLLLWPPWLLLCLLLALIAAALRLVPLHAASPAAKLVCAALVGASAALTACGHILPLERSLYLAIALASGLGGAFLAIAIWPRALANSARAPSLLLALFYALLPLGLGLQTHALAHSAAARAYGALPAYRSAWLAMYAGISALGAMLTRMHVHAAGHGATPTEQHQQHQQQRRSRSDEGAAGADGMAAWRPGAQSSVARRADAYGRRVAMRRAGVEWMAQAGSLCALTSLALCQTISVLYLDGSCRSVVVLSPLLLLLQPYTPPLTALHQANRYAPVGTAIAASLLVGASLEIASRLGEPMKALRGLALVCCALPSLLLCCRFLWDARQRSSTLLWMALPLNAAPLLLSHSRPMYDLGGAGVLAGALHLWLARRAKDTGLKYI